MTSIPDTFLSARDMLASLHAGDIDASELLELHVERMEKVNPTINAVIRTDLPAARARARELDRMARAGERAGPLHGLPMTVKDTFDVNGMPAAAGAPEYIERPARTPDAEAVAKVRSAGAVIWGKTNTPYLAGDNQTFNEIHGRTNNPWDLGRTPGGSSGGAAAALATGLSPIEIGSDIGGSLRFPAHFCGVAALKPTFGRVPILGHVPPAPGSLSIRDLNVAGPMARSARDLSLLYSVLSGEPDRVGRNASLKSRRIGIWSEEKTFPLDRRCGEAIEDAADVISQTGAKVSVTRPPIDGPALLDLYLQLLLPILATDMPRPLVKAMEMGRPLTKLLVKREPYSHGKWVAYSAATHHDWLKADEARQRLKRNIAHYFDNWDAIICPIAPSAAFEHIDKGNSVTRKLLVDGESTPYHTFHSWIALATVCHLPAVVIPVPQKGGGLPAGIQIIGPEGADNSVLAIAEEIERVLGGFVVPPDDPPTSPPPPPPGPKPKPKPKPARTRSRARAKAVKSRAQRVRRARKKAQK